MTLTDASDAGTARVRSAIAEWGWAQPASPMLAAITPVILTYNEEPNIARLLSQLTWARDIVVVDSGSTDDTLTILAADHRVRLFTRSFDSHHAQWRFAVENTDLSTAWILRLDADYRIPEGLLDEIAGLDPDGPVAGYAVRFDYAVFARRLRTSLYPGKLLLLRRGCFSIRDQGHTEGWSVTGERRMLRARALHDDWKPVDGWLTSQARYMKRELTKPRGGPNRNLEGAPIRNAFRDWLRSHPPLGPIAVCVYCLFVKGLVLNGRAGLFYTLQRTIAEAVLSLLILESRLRLKLPDPADDAAKADAGANRNAEA